MEFNYNYYFKNYEDNEIFKKLLNFVKSVTCLTNIFFKAD